MRCSIIRRVSTSKQASEEKTSLEDQLNDCLESIKQRKWTFVRDFNFGDTHGQDMKSHPLYAEIKRHIEQNECDIIMTHRIDRTLRDKYFWLDLCDLLQQHSKLIASPFEIFDPINIDHEFTLDIKSVFGHHERKRIRERALRGMKSIKDKGKWTGGKPPLGYDYDKFDKNEPLKINETEADIIRIVIKLIQKKYTKVEIADYLNERGYQSKRNNRFTPRIIRRILAPYRLLFYSGQRYDSKFNIIKATWEPIISIEDYQKVIAIKKSWIPGNWSRKPAYLLTGMGIFKCGYCDHSIKTTNNRHKSKGGSFYYYCSGYYKTKGFCKKSKNIKMDLIDSVILNDIKIRLKNLHIIELGYQALLEKSDNTKAIENFKHQLTDLDKRKANLIKAIELNTISLDDVKDRLSEIDTNRNIILSQLSELTRQYEKIDIDEIEQISKTIDKINEFELSDKREIIQLCIEKIELFNKILIINYKFPIQKSGKKIVKIELIGKKPSGKFYRYV